MVKKQIEPCTKEEIDKIIDAASDNDYYQTLFILAKSTGRRLGEYLMIRGKDINWENKTVQTLVLKRKIHIFKDALLTDETTRILKSFVLRHKIQLEQFVFGAKSKIAIQKAIKRYATKAGITHNVCFHNFRHYFVTHFLKEGWSYDQIAKLTGHSTPQTLIHYDHAVLADVRFEAEKALRNI